MAAMPLIQNQVVDLHGWLTLTSSRSYHYFGNDPRAPSPSTRHLRGHPNRRLGRALVATFGCILPSCVHCVSAAWLNSRYKRTDGNQGSTCSLRPTVCRPYPGGGGVHPCAVLLGDRRLQMGYCLCGFHRRCSFCNGTFSTATV